MLKKIGLVVFTGFTVFGLSYFGFINEIARIINKSGNEVAQNSKEVLGETLQTPTVTSVRSQTVFPQLLSAECSVDCTNCIHFPVSKLNQLRSDYIPEVTAISFAGAGNFYFQAVTELEGLLTEAKNQGLKPRIVSSYRSYQTQQNLFNGYVVKEMNRNGATRERAEEIANIYSARPGHSEHQLGTTVDISCEGCVPFANDTKNQQIYDFLIDNVSKYGFVVSYTKQNSGITGYKPEPWHIRYIGVTLAEKYYQKYNELAGNYSLDQYLSENCQK